MKRSRIILIVGAAMLFAAADHSCLGQNAAQLAAYVHADAGDRSRDKSGEQAMLAGDMVSALGEVFRSLSAITDRSK